MVVIGPGDIAPPARARIKFEDGRNRSMSTEARTEYGVFIFSVKEGTNPYRLFIAAEPVTDTTLLGKDAFLSFNLKTLDINEAHRVATYMGQQIESLGFTMLDTHPVFSAKQANE
jgi:hypothetical protein